MTKAAVLGAGAWGTAISCVLAARLEVTLWARDAAQAASVGATRRNERYLPGFELPSTVQVSADLAEATRDAELLLAATPVAGLRSLLGALATPAPLVWLCKGFEEGSGELPHQIARAALGSKARFGALSGPSFAEEVARGLPCALTLASGNASFAREAAALLHGGRRAAPRGDAGERGGVCGARRAHQRRGGGRAAARARIEDGALTLAGEAELAPGFEYRDGDCVRKIEAAISWPHRQAQPLLLR